jgi:hypothetical protein
VADEGRRDQPGARVPGRPEPARYVPPAQPSGTSRGIHIEITPRNVRLVPGETETATITVRNLGSVVDEVTLTVSGDAAGWARVAPDTLNIYPGTEAQATIRFAPPRAPLPPAGLLELDVALTSRSQPEASTVYRGSLELGAYDNLSVAAVGSTYLTGKREAILPIKVRNLGNRATGVYLTASDLFGARVTLSSPSLGLEPGAEATVWATVRATDSRSGAPTQYPFSVSVSGDYTPPVTIDGRLELEQRAPGSKRRWPIVALALVGLGLVAAGAVFVLANSGLLGGPGASAPPSGVAFSPLVTLGPTTGPTIGPTDGLTAPPGETTEPPGETTAPPDETTAPPDEPTPTPTEAPTPYTLAGWEPIGGGEFTQSPAVTSWGPGRLDIFSTKSDGLLYHNWYDGTGWQQEWEQRGTGQVTFKPSAVSWGPDRIDVFAIGTDKAMYQLTYDAGTWSDWQSIGGGFLQAGPGVSSWGAGRLDVFGRGLDEMLWHRWFDGTNWSPSWEQQGSGTFIKAPAAVSWTFGQGFPNRFDVVALRSDKGPIDELTYGEDFGWVDWSTLGGTFNAAPGISSWGPNHLDVFGQGTDNTLYRRTWDGAWTDWQQVSPVEISSAPTAVSWGLNRIDVFALGDDDGIYHRYYQDGVWGP